MIQLTETILRVYSQEYISQGRYTQYNAKQLQGRYTQYNAKQLQGIIICPSLDFPTNIDV